ncbi:hypothetical protein [Mycobacterium talmoniae]|uniref:GP55 protein n=1 Tax=Mycobacterium talmoniae TaxID=1858794 RepID=A0A1S1NJI1_9MYCO|nr:hypothetical protein [Mycobacterium talmoniae]OHV04594.1 hypothetical protein BKN37_09130 [Mycobacterium talmoniae]PQM45115.1 hypothetical protein C1Y40_04718 [Mycobacterium talmoniae]
MIKTALVTATLVAILCSLWIRRDTWRSRWEAGATLNIALQGCAVLLMSHWAAAALGPPLHRIFGLWNIQHLLGHICWIFAVTAIIQHALTRLVNQTHLRGLLRKHVARPLWLGIPLLLAVFIIADESHHLDLFSAPVNDFWLEAYWLVLGGLLIYLLSYAARVLLIARADPRSTETVDLYLISAGFGVAAHVIQIGTAWMGVDVTLPVWVCACLGATGFAYGSARSWQSKLAWFTPGNGPRSQAVPPY